MTAVERLAFYRLSDGETVVQIVGDYRGRLRLRDVHTGECWRTERAPFRADVHGGAVERVRPRFEAVEGPARGASA